MKVSGEKESFRDYLIRGASGTFVLKVASTLLSFIISLLLAQLLGAAGYGVYAYALSWVVLLSVPAVLGFNHLLVREVAVYHVRADWGHMRGLLRFSNRIVSLSSLVLMVFASFASWFLFHQATEDTMLYALWLALPLIPVTALIHLRQSAMRGLHCVIRGQVPEMLIRPLLFIALVVSVCLLTRQYLSPLLVITLNLFAAIVAFGVGARWLQKILPKDIGNAEIRNNRSLWMSGALPLLFFGSMQVINSQADIIMLGILGSAKAVGIYTVANRCAGLITFVLIAVNTSFAPIIARFYASGEMDRLQREVTRNTRMILLLSLPIALALILFRVWFLLLFGPDFTQGQTALTILSIGQLVNTGAGSVGLLLIMTGHEREAAWGVSVSAVANVILNALLIPVWGLEGAAMATACSMILWNIILAWFVWQRLKVHSTALGVVRLGR